MSEKTVWDKYVSKKIKKIKQKLIDVIRDKYSFLLYSEGYIPLEDEEIYFEGEIVNYLTSSTCKGALYLILSNGEYKYLNELSLEELLMVTNKLLID